VFEEEHYTNLSDDRFILGRFNDSALLLLPLPLIVIILKPFGDVIVRFA
jgi:hypothetical protein